MNFYCFSPLLLLLAVHCASPVTPTESQSAAVGAASPTSRTVGSPALLALQKAATADLEQYEISVRGIAVPADDAGQNMNLGNGFRTYFASWYKNPAINYQVQYPDNMRWDQGSGVGKKCAWASIFRFEAIFANPPPEALAVLGVARDAGGFVTRIDDYAASNSIGNPTPTNVTGSWRWIAASGSADAKGNEPAKEICRIPTRAQVVSMMIDCLARAKANNRVADGCQTPEYAAPPAASSEADEAPPL